MIHGSIFKWISKSILNNNQLQFDVSCQQDDTKFCVLLL